jgi:hypothetical protein
MIKKLMNKIFLLIIIKMSTTYTDAEPSKSKSKKGVKNKSDKYNGFKVPRSSNKTTLWGLHIYKIMKEANPDLLLRDDVRVAYNNFIDYLSSLNDIFESWLPLRANYYEVGIKINFDSIYDKNIPGRFTLYNYNYDVNYIPTHDRYLKIKEKYIPLYELIKRDVVPYIETKQYEITSKKEIQFNSKQIGNLEKEIKHLEDRISYNREQIYEYAVKSLELQKGPTLTIFD